MLERILPLLVLLVLSAPGWTQPLPEEVSGSLKDAAQGQHLLVQAQDAGGWEPDADFGVPAAPVRGQVSPEESRAYALGLLLTRAEVLLGYSKDEKVKATVVRLLTSVSATLKKAGSPSASPVAAVLESVRQGDSSPEAQAQALMRCWEPIRKAYPQSQEWFYLAGSAVEVIRLNAVFQTDSLRPLKALRDLLARSHDLPPAVRHPLEDCCALSSQAFAALRQTAERATARVLDPSAAEF